MRELDDDHGIGGDDQKMDQVLHIWKEKKRKAKPYGDQGKGINRNFVLALKTP